MTPKANLGASVRARLLARLNRERVGLGLTVFVAVNIHDHADKHAEDFKRAVRAMPEVVACHVTSGDHDFLLQVVAPDLPLNHIAP